jgi:hypothetical protein
MRIWSIVIALLLVVAVGVGAAAGQYNLYVPRDPAFPIVMLVVNGEPKLPDVPPMVIDGRTMVPLRFLAEAFGAEVGWDQDTYTVSVKYQPQIKIVSPPATPEKREPKIIGLPQFEQTMRQALNLLLARDLEGYMLVCGYLDTIVQTEHTGVVSPLGLFLHRPADYPQDVVLYWEAAALVHEATHVWLHRKNYVYAGKEAEEFCTRAQIESMRKLGAPEWMVKGAENALQTGYWEVPYEQRNW